MKYQRKKKIPNLSSLEIVGICDTERTIGANPKVQEDWYIWRRDRYCCCLVLLVKEFGGSGESDENTVS